MAERWRFEGVRLPDGELDALWIADGLLRRGAVDGAELLPGRFVLPGLVDAHAHPTIDMAERGAPWGSEALVEANLEENAFAGELLIREIGAVGDRWSLEGIGERLPRMQRAGRFVAPAGGYYDWLRVFTQPEAARDEVGRQIAAGATWIKVVGDWPVDGGIRVNYEPEVLRGLVDAAHAAGARVGGARHVACGDRGGHRGGRRLPGARAVAGRGTGPTDGRARHGVDADPGGGRAVARWLRGSGPAGVHGGGAPGGRRALSDRAADGSRLGVPVLAGTDVLPPGSMAVEIAALHRWGLTPTEALESATTVARAYLGEPALDSGAPADLVTYDADPRDDPEVLRTPASVLLHGRRIR